MSTKIEQLIDEIEDYIENCKYVPLSNNMIKVNKDEIEELLMDTAAMEEAISEAKTLLQCEA